MNSNVIQFPAQPDTMQAYVCRCGSSHWHALEDGRLVCVDCYESPPNLTVKNSEPPRAA